MVVIERIHLSHFRNRFRAEEVGWAILDEVVCDAGLAEVAAAATVRHGCEKAMRIAPYISIMVEVCKVGVGPVRFGYDELIENILSNRILIT